MIANLDREQSTEARCLDLIWRNAPKFLKRGGGALQRESSYGQAQAIRHTPEQKHEIRRLALGGKHSPTEIARIVGSTQSRVYKLLAHAGIKPTYTDRWQPKKTKGKAP